LDKVKKDINSNMTLTKTKVTDMQGSEREVSNTISALTLLIDDCTKVKETERITEKINDKVEITEFSNFKALVE
jgi:hypothetical protein